MGGLMLLVPLAREFNLPFVNFNELIIVSVFDAMISIVTWNYGEKCDKIIIINYSFVRQLHFIRSIFFFYIVIKILNYTQNFFKTTISTSFRYFIFNLHCFREEYLTFCQSSFVEGL